MEIRGDLSEYSEQIFVRKILIHPDSIISNFTLKDISLRSSEGAIVEIKDCYGSLAIENSTISGNISKNSIFYFLMPGAQETDRIQIRNTVFESN